jgi:hypothetical protein
MVDELNDIDFAGGHSKVNKEVLRLEKILADDEFIPELKLKNEHLLK